MTEKIFNYILRLYNTCDGAKSLKNATGLAVVTVYKVVEKENNCIIRFLL